MVAVPEVLPVTVILFPETLTVAIPELPEMAEIAPSPARVTVIVPVFVVLFSVILVGLRLREPAAFPIVQFTVFAVVVPSAHL